MARDSISGGDFVQRLARNGKRRYYTKNQQHTGIHTHDDVCLGRRVLAGTIDVRFCSLSTLSLFVEWLLAVGVRVRCQKLAKSKIVLQSGRRATKQHKESSQIKDRWGLRTALRGCGAAERPRLPLTIA